MPDSGGVADALTAKLQELGVEVLRIEPQSERQSLAEQAEGVVRCRPDQGRVLAACIGLTKVR